MAWPNERLGRFRDLEVKLEVAEIEHPVPRIEEDSWGKFLEPAAADLGDPGPAQDGEMFGSGVRRTADGGGDFGDHERLARGEDAQDFPASFVADGLEQ